MKKSCFNLFIPFLILIGTLAACAPAAEMPRPASDTPFPTNAEPTDVPTPTITPSPTPVPIKPMDLLDESLNPFSDLNLPEEFTFDSINLYKNSQTQGYNYLVVTNRSLQDTISLVGDMVTFQNEVTTEKMNQELQQYGKLRFQSEYNGVIINTDIEPEDDHLLVEFKYYINEEDWITYQPYLEKNFNESIFPFAGNSLFDLEPERTEITIRPNDTRIHSLKQYALDDTTYNTYKEILLSQTFIEDISQNTLRPANISTEGEISIINGEQNNINYSINIENNEIWIFESVFNLDKNFVDYNEPSVTSGSLMGLGFDERFEDKPFIAYKHAEYDNGFMIMINKTEWGAEQDSIEIVSRLFGKYHLTYKIEEKQYYLDMEDGEYFTKLIYNPATGEITSEDENLDFNFQKESIQQLSGMPFEDGVLWLVSRTTDFIGEQFNYTIDELFEAPLQ